MTSCLGDNHNNKQGMEELLKLEFAKVEILSYISTLGLVVQTKSSVIRIWLMLVAKIVALPILLIDVFKIVKSFDTMESILEFLSLDSSNLGTFGTM